MTFWSRLGSRDRRALVVGASLLAPALCLNLAVRPYLHGRAALRDRVGEQRELLSRELALLAQARRLPVMLDMASGTLAAARSRLFPGRDPLAAVAALVSAVGEEARRQGVQIEAIESRAPEPVGGGLVAIQVDVAGRGDLEGLLRWLAALEAAPRLLRVEQLGVARAGSWGSADSLDVETLTVAASVRGYLLVGADAGTTPAAVASAETDP